MQVPVGKVSDAKRFRSEGHVLGVGAAADGAMWLELGSTVAGIPPMLLSIVKAGAQWRIVHKCSLVSSGKQCWHLGAALDVAHEVAGLPKLTLGSYAVDLDLKHPLTPAGPLTDVTRRIEGHDYAGSKLLTVLVADPIAPASSGAGPGGVPSAGMVSAAPTPSTSSSPGFGAALFLDPEADQVARYLDEMDIPTQMRDAVLNARRQMVPAEYAARVPKGPIFRGNREEFKLAIACFLLEKNLFTVGPKSSGKTALTVTLAWVFNLPLFTINGSLQTEVADMRGDKSLEVEPESKQAHVTYVLGTITEAMKVGGLGYVDEMPNIREGIAVWLNGLDWRKTIEIPGYGSIQAHPSFRLAMSGNKGYAGCAVPNEATIDRTTVIEMPYAEEIARIILQESRNKNAAAAQKLEKFFQAIKFLIEKKEIRTAAPLTIRGLIDAADYMQMGIPGKIALRSCVLNKMWDSSEKDREKVSGAIDSYFK